MDIQKIKLELLNPAEYNPRRDLKPGDKEYEKLQRSIAEFGFVEPIVWNKTTGNVVGGHQRLKIMRDMGETDIDCVVVELDLLREKALNVALNKIQGDWDETKLAELMAGLDETAFDVSFTGFDADEVDALLNEFYSKGAVQDKFDIDKETAEVEGRGVITRHGDIWQLGNHRLMCGDAANSEEMGRLMAGERAQVAVTSPPLSVDDYAKAGIEPWAEMMKPAVRSIAQHAEIVCWQMGDMYSTGTQFIEPTGFFSVQMFAECGFRPLWIRVWKKQGARLGAASYRTASTKPAAQYEYVTAFAGREMDEYNDQEYVWLSAFAGHSYKFVRRLTKEERRDWGYAGVWEIAPVGGNTKGMDIFPVELPWRCIKMHSDRGGIVLEPFAGSGTTIVAAEQTERRCYAMELSPTVCDLAVKRWESFTGETAVRLEEGI